MENTHNSGGGAVYPIEPCGAIRTLADSFGLGLHMDGARIWNAHTATGVPLRDYGAIARHDVGLHVQGLGRPGGLAGAAARRPLPRRPRSCAAASADPCARPDSSPPAPSYALDHHLARLPRTMRTLGCIAAALRSAGASVREPETNIVLIDADAAPSVAREAAPMLRISPFGPKLLRIVTHLDVSAEDCDTAADVGFLRLDAIP